MTTSPSIRDLIEAYGAAVVHRMATPRTKPLPPLEHQPGESRAEFNEINRINRQRWATPSNLADIAERDALRALENATRMTGLDVSILVSPSVTWRGPWTAQHIDEATQRLVAAMEAKS